jgi:hypothetical protein
MENKKQKTKIYDLWWNEKQKHIKKEMERVIKENGLESQLIPFTKTPKEYEQLAEEKLTSNNKVINDSKSQKEVKDFSVGLDF